MYRVLKHLKDSDSTVGVVETARHVQLGDAKHVVAAVGVLAQVDGSWILPQHVAYLRLLRLALKPTKCTMYKLQQICQTFHKSMNAYLRSNLLQL